MTVTHILHTHTVLLQARYYHLFPDLIDSQIYNISNLIPQVHTHTHTHTGGNPISRFRCGSGWHSNSLILRMGLSQGQTGRALLRRLQHQPTHTDKHTCKGTNRHAHLHNGYTCNMGWHGHTKKRNTLQRKNEQMMSNSDVHSLRERERE